MIRILVAMLLTQAAFGGKQFITTSDLWSMRTVADPRIRQDGKYVAYVLQWNDKMNDAIYSNIWVAQSDGRDERPITTGNFKDTSPRWSRDGNRLAYVSNRSGKPQIRVRWMDSGQEAQITNLQEAPTGIEWSPDGKWIAFLCRVPGKNSFSVKLPEKPVGANWADPAIVVEKLHWRSDAQGILQPGYLHLFVVPATGGAPRQITSGDFDHTGGFGSAQSISWTADAQWIVAPAQREKDAEYSFDGSDIYAFSVADGGARQLTTRKGPDTEPEVSPDGTKIAYIGFDSRMQSYTVSNLYVMNADGTNPRLLTAKHDRDVRSPKWASDGKSIFFLSDTQGAAQLYEAKLEGTLRQITAGPQRLGSAYAMTETFSISRNGTVATTRSTPLEPADIVVFPIAHPDRRTRLTAANESLLADRKLGAVEEFTFDSFDGKPIQGWIVKPPDFDGSRRYPLLLEIHGGPHGMYGLEFNHEFQAQAARGFVVLYVNPRGSTGYGEEFGNIIHTKYPGDDYKDLMAAVDAVIAKGYVDAKKLTVTGGSGGGLLTAWIVGHTDRFAAAVSQYPVTNWFTEAGTADIGYLTSALWMKALPWENPQQYIEHSPIFYAKNFRTPTMVLTGEADLRTPIAQSEELYFALKARKVPAVLVRIPDEPHGIRGAHPSHRIAKMEYVLAWLEKWTLQ